MHSNPLVSVVIPTFNRGYVIERAIRSVLSQSYPNLELIVVDDGSTDNTKEICLKYRRVKYFYMQNKGVSAARNFGITLASGFYISFLDSDDEWLPSKIELQVKYMDNFKLRWVHGEERWVRKGVRVNPKKIHKKSGGDIFIPSLSLCLISPSTVLLQKELLLEFGGFDESYIVCEDFDLWLRILNHFEIGFIDEELIIKYGGHEDQLSTKYKAMDHFRIKTYLKLINEKNLSYEKRKAVNDIAIKKCKILHNGYEKHGHKKKACEIKKILSRFGSN